MALDGVYKIREADVDGTVDYHIGEGKDKDGEKTAKEDYYTSNQETVESLSQWVNPMGFGGVSGGVRASDLKAVLHAVDPTTGESVIAKRHPKRVAGLEWVYSVPKPFSGVWGVAEKSVAARFEQTILRCARDSVIDWNAKGCKVRVGSGAVKVSATPVIAQIVHGVNRNGDPQLHLHSISSGFATAADGRSYAIDTLELTRTQSAEAARFHVAFAVAMINEFGIAVERDGRNFKIGGEHAPSQELIDFWSSRRRDIEDFMETARAYLEAKKEGRDISDIDPQVRQFVDGRKSQNPADHTFDNRPLARAIATFTKDSKDDKTQDEHRSKWRAEALEHGFDVEKVFGQVEALKPLTEAEKQAFIDSVLADMFEKESAVSVYKVEQLFAEHAIGRMGLEDLDSCVEMAKQNRDLIMRESAEGYPIYTTAEKLSHELAIVDAVRLGQVGQEKHQLDNIVVNGVISGYETMEDEQAQAVRYAAGARSVFIVEGHAGAGKSFTMNAVRESHERAGYETIGVAKTADAAKNLQNSSGIQSITLDRFLGELRDGKRAIGEKTLVVCDEVGLVGSAFGAELLTKMREAGGKVGLVGDRGQMLSIQAGSLMHLAAEESEIAVLANIRRQHLDPTDVNPNWRREASMKLAAGDVVGALKDFEDRGHIRLEADRKAAFKQIAQDWRDAVRDGKSVAVLAYTNADVKRLNQELRAIRRADGFITGEDIEIRTGSSKSDRIQVAIGDRLMTGKNDYKEGLINGEVGTVEAIREVPAKGKFKTPGHEITMRMESGEQRTIDTRTYIKDDGSVYLGYADAMTVFKSQGRTVDQTLLYGNENFNQRLAYVACTRARGNTTVYLNKDSIEEAYVNDQRHSERGPPTDQDLRDYVDGRWSKKPEKAMALEHIPEAEAREIVKERQARKEQEKLARQVPEAIKAASEIRVSVVGQIKPLLSPDELLQAVAQRERIDKQIMRGSTDKHVVVIYTQSALETAQDEYKGSTIVKARPEQGLIGHQLAMEAVSKADRITVIHPIGSKAEDRERIDAQIRRQAGEGRKVDHFRPEDFKDEKGRDRSFEEVVATKKAERSAQERQQALADHARLVQEEQQRGRAGLSQAGEGRKAEHPEEGRVQDTKTQSLEEQARQAQAEQQRDWGGPTR